MLVHNTNINQRRHAGQTFTSASSSSANVFSQLYKGLKKGSVSKTDLSAFGFNLVSGSCYLVGGTGLLYDFAHQKSRNNADSSALKMDVKPFLTPKSIMQFANKDSQPMFGKVETSKPKKSEGAQTIVPETEFAKTGMKFARVAVGVAGIAGIMTGLSMNLPLWALGEGITAFSAPIIETPVGTGIFGFGLALINLARVLDSNPEFQINRDKFKSATTNGKVKLIADNFAHTFKELGVSTKTIFKNLFGLVTPKHKESFGFFKNKMFSFKPAAISVQELLTKEGKIITNTRAINNPYLMHFAAFGLSTASISLIISNMLKARKAEKTSLRAYGVSNGIDNIALSKWGVEKFSAPKATATGKATGGAFALAGASLLSGQAGIDQNWGRGLMWNGIGFILLGMAVETGVKVLNAIKTKKISPVVVREWKILANDKILNSSLVKSIENGLKEALDSDGYRKGSDNVLNLLKDKISKIKEAEGIDIKMISDTDNIEKIQADMLAHEKKLFGSAD